MPRWEFLVSPRFEVCYALALLAEPGARLHAGWRGAALERLGERFAAELAGFSKVLWIALPEVLGAAAPVPEFELLLQRLRELDEGEFQRRLLIGLLHDEEVAAELATEGATEGAKARATGGATVGQALARLPEAKRAWLAHIGLLPHRPEAPAPSLLERLARAPGALHGQVCDLLEAFWERALAPTWARLAPQLDSSKARAERLFECCGPGEFAAAVRLLVEVDEAGAELRAARGGYRIALAELEACYVLPSAFNYRRFWSVAPAGADGADGVVAFLPYFDPALELETVAGAAPRRSRAEPDPALVCKALGDATRFSMLALLARGPRNGAELAKELGLSTPTISHHVFQLREAGVVAERARGNAVELSVDRAALEALSGRLIARLFGGGAP